MTAQLAAMREGYLRHGAVRFIPYFQTFTNTAAPLARLRALWDEAIGFSPDVVGLAALARREGLWYHVDAAYGAAARFSPRDSGRVPGLELTPKRGGRIPEPLDRLALGAHADGQVAVGKLPSRGSRGY